MNLVRDWVRPRDWGAVDQGEVYRSGQLSRFLVGRTLRDTRVGLIITLAGDRPATADIEAEKAAAGEMGIERLVLNMPGTGTGDIRTHAKALAALHDARCRGKVVLVHCQTGSERTGAVIAYWRVLVEHRPGREAYRELRYFHHSSKANPKLVPYLNQHMEEMAHMLVERHVIDAVPDPLPVIGP